MARTVTALFTSRTQAEAARANLSSAVKVETARILARDTAGALDGLSIDPKQVKLFREALQGGSHLLVATVARGEKPQRIIDSVKKARTVAPESNEAKLSYEIGANLDPAPPGGVGQPEESGINASVPATTSDEAPRAKVIPTAAEQAAEPVTQQEPSARREVERSPMAEDKPEVRIGERQVKGGESTSFSVSDPKFESRIPSRRLSDEEVVAGGLLRDRVIEVVEMREEPVIAREVFVREEVIVRKTVNQRTETIDETVRRTDVEVEKLG